MRRTAELRVFAPPLLLLAITSISLALVMHYSEHRFYMFMMFAGIVSAQIDLAVAWLVFGGGSYWVRLPLIGVLAVAISYLMSYTFPQTLDVWFGVLLIRIPAVGLPLLVARFRGAQLVHAADPPDKQRATFQFSLASLMTLFTTTAVYAFAGRFAVVPRELFSLIVFSCSAVVSLAAMAAAWSHRHTVIKVMLVIWLSAIVCFAPAWLGGPGFDAFGMMIGALIVSIMTPIMLLRMFGYSVIHVRDQRGNENQVAQTPATPDAEHS